MNASGLLVPVAISVALTFGHEPVSPSLSSHHLSAVVKTRLSKRGAREKSQASVLSASEYEYAEMMVIRIPLSVVQSVNKPAGLQSHKSASKLMLAETLNIC